MMIKKQYSICFTLFVFCTASLLSCRKGHKSTLMQEIDSRDSIAIQTYMDELYHQKIKDSIKGFWTYSSYETYVPLWQFGLIFQEGKENDSIYGTYHLIRQGEKQENGWLKGILIKGKITAELYNPKEFPGEKTQIELTGLGEKSYDDMQLEMIKVPERLSYLSETFALSRFGRRQTIIKSGCAYPGHIKRRKTTTNAKK
ncbi:hypothetical protein V2E39_12370 [Chryseobacterium arthrosphaerae]|uniref:Lipoprotein n=1 Tax=Chryseobacterium arthrosphaerae TaxID=651561 RepID=A0ABU7R026_9FLAO|nr:hypothetical protein [Chryseobacterium arthrosphaerae]